jgi:PEP-CTERM motif
MKTTQLIIGATACAAAVLVLGNSNAHAQNLLSDPGFESGTVVPNGSGGWDTFGDSSFSTVEAMTGVYSMFESGSGNYSVPGCVQFLASAPGLEYNLSGYGYITSALTGASEAEVQITFWSGADGTGNNLGTVETSPGNAFGSNPISSTSTMGTWIYLDTGTVEAPAGTESIAAYAIVLDANPSSAYFDNLDLTQVPEPSSLALLGAGLGIPFYLRRRFKS